MKWTTINKSKSQELQNFLDTQNANRNNNLSENLAFQIQRKEELKTICEPVTEEKEMI